MPAVKLTLREDQVLHLMALGLTTGEVAAIISTGEDNVKIHLRKVYRALGVRRGSGAAREAITRAFILGLLHSAIMSQLLDLIAVHDPLDCDLLGELENLWAVMAEEGDEDDSVTVATQIQSRYEAVRFQAAELFAQEVQPSQIALQLRVGLQTVYQWRRRWRDGGLAALASKRRTDLSAPEQAELPEPQDTGDHGDDAGADGENVEAPTDTDGDGDGVSHRPADDVDDHDPQDDDGDAHHKASDGVENDG